MKKNDDAEGVWGDLLGVGFWGEFAGGDLEAVGDGGEAHGVGDGVAELDDLFVGEGDDFAGVEVEEVVVAGVGGVGGADEVVVGLFAGAEEDLFEEAGVEEVFEGAIDGGFGDAEVGFAEGEEEFVGFERAGEAFDGLEEGGAFGGVFELALAEEVAEDLLGGGHGESIRGNGVKLEVRSGLGRGGRRVGGRGRGSDDHL